MKAAVDEHYFQNDAEASAAFFEEEIIVLNLLRNALLGAIDDDSGKSPDEVTYFQPFVQLYLEGLLAVVAPNENAGVVGANGDMLEVEGEIWVKETTDIPTTIRTKKKRFSASDNKLTDAQITAQAGSRHLVGKRVKIKEHTDLWILFDDSSVSNALSCRTNVELTAPLGALTASGSCNAAKDQTFLQGRIISEMRRDAGIKDTFASVLTDLFSIRVIANLQRGGEIFQFVTANITDPQHYIMAILFSMLPANTLEASVPDGAISLVEESGSEDDSEGGSDHETDGHQGSEEDGSASHQGSVVHELSDEQRGAEESGKTKRLGGGGGGGGEQKGRRHGFSGDGGGDVCGSNVRAAHPTKAGPGSSLVLDLNAGDKASVLAERRRLAGKTAAARKGLAYLSADNLLVASRENARLLDLERSRQVAEK